MTTYFKNKIERINCPFDFSKTGRAGLNYAGMLAAALDAKLTIFYVQPSLWPEEVQLYEDQNDSSKGIRRLLKLEAEAIAQKFGIDAEYAIEPTTGDIEVPIGSMSTSYDLIVMGTNGADDLYNDVFGVNSHHVLGLTQCPVLMIPLGYDHHLPVRIAYALDSETNEDFLTSQLERLAWPLEAYLDTLHVESQRTSEAAQKMELLGRILGVEEQDNFNWGFEPTYSDNAVSLVDQYMKSTKTDILALTYDHRDLFEKLFRENVNKKVSRIADYPVLLFWH